jgi:hypothetical protein
LAIQSFASIAMIFENAFALNRIGTIDVFQDAGSCLGKVSNA